MASPSKPKSIYDVFLSFRGADVRKNFLSHLYTALDKNGIYTFQDSEELRKGDQISTALMEAIENSCMAIIIFSKDYASSWWCLEEVAKIMECKEQKDLTVLPVFYKVDPGEVRGGRESYGRGLAEHESKFGKDSEQVKRWKKALFDAGSLAGWHLNDGDESELIQRIVKEISTYLVQTPLDVAKHPVGISSQVVKLRSMLNSKSNDGVLMAGIWGQGGIGKSSLAKALYNAIFQQFDGSCFLANVRETSKGCGGLVTLQENLLNEILQPHQRLQVLNVDRGINLIRHRLGHKKVLLILDDVDDLSQLDALAREDNWYGNGSRIIITTRDKHLLTCHRIDRDHVYEVKVLDDNQARELLSKHAFQTHRIRKDLVDGALNYANGLPLALVVLGSLLCDVTENVWQSTLMKLSKDPDGKINNVLKVSYDALDKNEKEIFLHIACFFKGQAKEYTQKVLESCGFETPVGFDILIKRSLISIEERRIGEIFLKMHDLIQAMGMDIVNQECRDDPGKRSRLWLYDDVVNVLSRDMEDCAVKAIGLILPEPTEMRIDPNAFAKMRKLRLLIMHNVHDSTQGPIFLPNELKWFEWPRCDSRTPEFTNPKNLVGLVMCKGNAPRVVKKFKDFQRLKHINFSDCESLDCTPDVSCTPNLKTLILRDCKNMVEAHESIAHHENLQVLALSGCSQLSVFPKELKSKNLQFLDLKDCKNFERFPDIPYTLESLKCLILDGTAIKELPASVKNLISLVRMDLSNCKKLVSLPSNIYKLDNIEKLFLMYCIALIGFPELGDSTDPSMKTGLSSLQRLDLPRRDLSMLGFIKALFKNIPILIDPDLSGNNDTSHPTSIHKRNRFTFLNVENCHQLQEIPEFPSFLFKFWADKCESLQKTGDLISSHDFARRWWRPMVKPLPDDIIYLPGEEMPKWFLPIEGRSVSFRASKELFQKFIGLVFCFVLSNDAEKHILEVTAYVNGQSSHGVSWYPRLSDSNHICVRLETPSTRFGIEGFGRLDGSYVQFGLTLSSGNIKKWGIRIICEPLEYDLKVEIRDNQLIDPAFLYEVGYDSTDPEAESSHVHQNSSIEIDLIKNFEACQIGTGEHSQRGLKRKHEFNLPQGKRTKTMSASNSTGGDENEMRMRRE